MADYGFNFRATAGFVTDGTNESANLGEGYPHTYTMTGSGATVVAGWNSVNLADRNAGVDRRLAGIAYASPAAEAKFRVDTTAGTYQIYIAFGDHDNSIGPATFQVYDSNDTTLLATLVNNLTTAAANHYIDAGGTERTSDTDWVNNGSTVNASVTTTGSSIWFRLLGGAGYAEITHLRIATAASPASQLPVIRNRGRSFPAALLIR